MRTQSIDRSQNDFPSKTAISDSAMILNRALGLAAKGFTALVPAFAIVVGAAWAITVPGIDQFLQASLWACGFVFLALVIDSEKPPVGLPLATGIALPILALLSSRVASEFAIVGAVLVAIWVAALILRR